MCGFLDKYSARIVVVMMLLMRVFGRVQAFKTMYRAGRTATMMTTTRFTFVPRASLSPTTTWRLQSTLCEAASLEEEVPDSSSSSSFSVSSPFAPTADQPRAIETLLHQLRLPDNKYALLQGITGTGKTLVMSHVISRYGRPTLVLCHNKTLAAQLARELRAHLADSKVELFVSYYNHYVPESYQESTGRYVAKKSSVNSEIDILRHRATRALMTDAASQAVVVVASVSCIYGLGLPREYLDASMAVRVGDEWSLQSLYDKLASMLYTEHEMLEERGQFSVVSAANDKYTITLWAPHDKYPMQLQLEKGDGDGFVKVSGILQGTPQGFSTLDWARIFPAKHHVVSDDRLYQACLDIEDELVDRVKELLSENKSEEALRLQKRVTTDVAMMRETGFCAGGENYSRHLAGRAAGQAPDTLLDYFQDDWLLIVDESHVTLPQLSAMYAGDQARKKMLVKHGFRLPSALDNRPLKSEEFWERVQKAIFVSATPSKQELAMVKHPPVEMLIRPTFVCDPDIEVRSPIGQLEDLVREIQVRAQKNQRTLAMALTKRDAEDLASYLLEQGVKSTYIHSGLKTAERSEALAALQKGEVDCLVGVNLLREGLDLPQVSLVAILSADSEGFLRSETALLQTIGRAARNVDGKAIFYAKKVTESMRKCMDATLRRRKLQLEYNEEMGCQMRSTEGSTTMSLFDLLRDEIAAEAPLETVGAAPKTKAVINGDHAELAVAKGTSTRSKGKDGIIETDHIPCSPGVYFWKDYDGNILYIGKAVKLRSRVKSYLSEHANHSARIRTMVRKAHSVEFILTPSERDALVLESNLIKYHQPPFNVLLKDDEHYPYICASIGDEYPRFSIVPRRQELNALNKHYRYFGPYTSFKEINTILEGIEDKYDIRAKSFVARHGGGTKEEYQQLFNQALEDVFGGKRTDGSLSQLRSEFEQAGDLFDSPYNRCRDVVVAVNLDGETTSALVHVLQLREGLVAGRFSYTCRVPFGLTEDEDYASVIQEVLQRQHYPSGQESRDTRFSWFPDEVLVSHPLIDSQSVMSAIMNSRKEVEPSRKTKKVSIVSCAIRGPKKAADERALEFAIDNAQLAVHERSLTTTGALTSSLDGSAAQELANLLSLDNVPARIECYDISHTQGEYSVGSRVVFIGGKPAPELYRRFNIKTVDGIDDYASLEEVLERRFQRAWINGEGGPVDKRDPWALPDLVVIDGGPGQLGAAVKGMSKARVFPLTDGLVDHARESKRRAATVAVCALAKSAEQVYIVGQGDPVNDAPDSPAVLLLRALRDESHRFALQSHRKRRSIRNQTS